MNKIFIPFIVLFLLSISFNIALFLQLKKMESVLSGEKMKVTKYQIEQDRILFDIEKIRSTRLMEDSIRNLKQTKNREQNLETARTSTDAELKSIVESIIAN